MVLVHFLLALLKTFLGSYNMEGGRGDGGGVELIFHVLVAMLPGNHGDVVGWRWRRSQGNLFCTANRVLHY